MVDMRSRSSFGETSGRSFGGQVWCVPVQSLSCLTYRTMHLLRVSMLRCKTCRSGGQSRLHHVSTLKVDGDARATQNGYYDHGKIDGNVYPSSSTSSRVRGTVYRKKIEKCSRQQQPKSMPVVVVVLLLQSTASLYPLLVLRTTHIYTFNRLDHTTTTVGCSTSDVGNQITWSFFPSQLICYPVAMLQLHASGYLRSLRYVLSSRGIVFFCLGFWVSLSDCCSMSHTFF